MNKLQLSLILYLISATTCSISAQKWNDNTDGLYRWRATQNPIITHKHTADPAPFVKGDTLYLYTGIDYAGNQSRYRMYEWGLFTTTDMVTWTEHPSPLHVDEFKWQNSHNAYAAHVIERNGKYYFYISTNWCGIGVAVGDSPYGPFKDALGKQLLTNANCPGTSHSWACIDPAVIIDDDGQAWIYWGNRKCYAAKLKPNMIEIDGEIKDITPAYSSFTEAPWVHKHNGKYYLSFACGWPEKLGYAVSDNPDGPFEYKGIFSEVSGNSNTTHPGIVEFKGKTILFTHNGALNDGSGYSRSVCAQELKYDNEGNILKCDITTDGVPFIKPDNGNISQTIPTTPKTEAYLFTYFEGSGDNQESLRFGVSEDAVNWHALNGNQPILNSKDISNTGGIRDPHILRGAKGDGYYIVATDMYTKKNGWGFNPGIVLLHSNDLVHWSHAAIDFTEQYPNQFDNVQWVWAPQTVYDTKADKYLIYFTIKYKDAQEPDSVNPKRSTLDFYCAYANKDFTGFEDVPHLMWSPTYGAIDGDIIPGEDGLYHFFYKGNVKDSKGKEYKNGIKQAVSSSLYGPWFEDDLFIDAYQDSRTGVEGSGVFKLNEKDCKHGKTEYILMYDLYGSGKYEFQRTNNLIDFTHQPESFTKDFFPRHGTVLPITKKELRVLEKAFGSKKTELR